MNGRRAVQGAAVAVFLAGAAVVAFAKPAFMDRYNGDPYAKAAMHNKCTVCHVGHGGGERNDFGEAFADSGFRITPKLRAKFPELFESAPASDRTENAQKP